MVNTKKGNRKKKYFSVIFMKFSWSIWLIHWSFYANEFEISIQIVKISYFFDFSLMHFYEIMFRDEFYLALSSLNYIEIRTDLGICFKAFVIGNQYLIRIENILLFSLMGFHGFFFEMKFCRVFTKLHRNSDWFRRTSWSRKTLAVFPTVGPFGLVRLSDTMVGIPKFRPKSRLVLTKKL